MGTALKAKTTKHEQEYSKLHKLFTALVFLDYWTYDDADGDGGDDDNGDGGSGDDYGVGAGVVVR